MTQTEALKLALEALEIGWSPKYVNGVDAREKGMKAITAIKEALAQQCVCNEPNSVGTHRTDGPCFAPQPEQELDYKAIGQQAYESGYSTGYMDCAVKMKAQPEQEPVAWLLEFVDEDCMPRRDVLYEPRHLQQHVKHNTEVRGLACEVTPLYTHPPVPTAQPKQLVEKFDELEQPKQNLKLLPREATPEMLKAMDECSTEGYDERLYEGHAGSVYMAAWDAFHGQHCYCGDITNLGVIHRDDGPCHYPDENTK